MFRVLVTDGVDPDGVAILSAESALQVDVVPTLPPAELLARIGEYHALVGRSATKVTRELLEHATNLRVVGRAGVGIDNIAVDAATALGVAVINAPAGNTIAVAELVFGALIGLLRRLDVAATSMREGRWDRAQLLGRELKDKTLGIIGLGRIGTEVARRAHAFGMPLVGYDPYVGDERFTALRVRRAATLDALLRESNIVTVHTPLTDETRGLLGARELAALPPRSVVVNMARGGIIDEDALLAALQAGALRGAALDVYTVEPLAADHPLRSAPDLFLTPHIGANSVEAQRNVAKDVCVAVRDVLLSEDLSRSLNVAGADSAWREREPAMFLARRCAAVARAMLADQGARALRRLALRCSPDLASAGSTLLAAAALGVLEGVVETDRLNLINARTLAEARGIELSIAASHEFTTPGTLEVALAGGLQQFAVAGVAGAGPSGPRLTRIGSFQVDVNPRSTLIVLTNHDVPGVIGRVGTLLGEQRVNIAEYHQARLAQGGEALAAITVDDDGVDDDLRQHLLGLADVTSATIVRFRDR